MTKPKTIRCTAAIMMDIPTGSRNKASDMAADLLGMIKAFYPCISEALVESVDQSAPPGYLLGRLVATSSNPKQATIDVDQKILAKQLEVIDALTQELHQESNNAHYPEAQDLAGKRSKLLDGLSGFLSLLNAALESGQNALVCKPK